VKRTTEKIHINAIKLATGGPYSGSGPKPALAPSIRATYRQTEYTYSSRVGSRLRKAEPIHQGATRHFIRTNKAPGPALRFYWRKAGRFVAFAWVNHPGMRGKQYLVKPLRKYATRAGFRVVYVPKVR
jgi:hypothetical protein